MFFEREEEEEDGKILTRLELFDKAPPPPTLPSSPLKRGVDG